MLLASVFLFLVASATTALYPKHTIELSEQAVALSYDALSRQLLVVLKDQIIRYERNQTGDFAQREGFSERGSWQARKVGSNIICMDSSPDGELRILPSLKSRGEEIRHLGGFGEHPPTSLSSLQDDTIVVGLRNGTIYSYILHSSNITDLQRTIKSAHKRITKISSSEAGFAACGPENFASVYNRGDGGYFEQQLVELVEFVGAKPSKGCEALDLSGDGKRMAVSTLADEIFIFERSLQGPYKLVRKFWSPLSGRQTTLKWSKSGRYLLVINDDRMMTLWSSDNGFEKPLYSRFGQFAPVVDWAEDEQEFLVATGRTIGVYSLAALIGQHKQKTAAPSTINVAAQKSAGLVDLTDKIGK